MQPGERDAEEELLEFGEGGNSEEHPPLQEDPGEEAAPEDLEEIETGTVIGPAAGAARRSPKKKKKKKKPTIAAMEEDELKQIAQPPSEVIEELPSEEAMASRTMEGDSKEEKQGKKEAEKRR